MTSDIRLLVLDIDGVIIGGKAGYNFPLPSSSVTARLRSIGASGIPVVLCTTRTYESIEHIVAAIGLLSPQIVHGGAVIIDPVSRGVLHQKAMDRLESERIVRSLLKHGYPLQLYTHDQCFNQREYGSNEGMRLHDEYLKLSPRIAPNLVEVIRDADLIRMNTVVRGTEAKAVFMRHWNALGSSLEYHWVTVEHLLPWEFAIITSPGVSKRSGFLATAKLLGIDPHDALGVGDWIVDWEFMEECGSVGAMLNASHELKEKVTTKGEGHFFIGGHVDEDGLIEILEHFGL